MYQNPHILTNNGNAIIMIIMEITSLWHFMLNYNNNDNDDNHNDVAVTKQWQQQHGTCIYCMNYKYKTPLANKQTTMTNA